MVRRKLPEKEKSKYAHFGRSAYDPEQTPDLCFRLALLGLNNNEIAATLQVLIATFNLWIYEHPTLAEKLKEGRRIADSQVARALYKRATGFSVDDTVISLYKGEPVIVPTIKYYPPDTAAAVFWLKNRTRENSFIFSDNFDLSVRKEETIKLDLINTDLSDYTEEELEVLKKLTTYIKPKQIKEEE